MNISELVKAIGVPDFSFEPVDLECNGVKFKVKIKKEMSAADAEFIFGSKGEFDESFSARRIHRLVLFVVGESGDERPTVEQAQGFPMALINDLVSAIERVQMGRFKGGALVKKASRRKKISGTN